MQKDEGRASGVPPMVPSIWPLGHGCVMTTYGIAEGRPFFFFRGVRDDLIGEPGDRPGFDAWEACEGAPTLTLAFTDLASVKRLISSLSELAAELETPQPENPHEG